MIKRWLRNWLFKDEIELPQQLQMEVLTTGKEPGEKIEFWMRMRNWLSMDEGKAFMAIQQNEYNRIHAQLLTNVDATKETGLVAQLRQQNFVISAQVEVDRKIAKWQQRALAKEKQPSDYPKAA